MSEADRPATPDERLLTVLQIPLFLMGLGGLFLAEDYLNWSVSRTWPSLLILWGALLAAARRSRTD